MVIKDISKTGRRLHTKGRPGHGGSLQPVVIQYHSSHDRRVGS